MSSPCTHRQTLAVSVLAVALFGGCAGCTDPPLPEPTPTRTDLPRWSSAPYVNWQGPEDAGGAPWALILDETNGPIDRLLHDFDVATVLNDRFSAWFLVPDAAPTLTQRWGAPTITFLDPAGCPLAGPSAPKSPAAFITLANAALRSAKAAPHDSLSERAKIESKTPLPLEQTPGSAVSTPLVFRYSPEATCKSPPI
jgi:hypothetical protein